MESPESSEFKKFLEEHRRFQEELQERRRLRRIRQQGSNQPSLPLMTLPLSVPKPQELSIEESILMSYQKLADKGHILVSEEHFKYITEKPVSCALRILSGYNLDEHGPILKKVAIISAASLAYGAYYLDEEFGIYPSIWTWFKLLDIPPEYAQQFKQIQLRMFEGENYDVCHQEKGNINF